MTHVAFTYRSAGTSVSPANTIAALLRTTAWSAPRNRISPMSSLTVEFASTVANPSAIPCRISARLRRQVPGMITVASSA
jgi:hypothetical protein